ncbi:hypothetical protein U1Q18_047810, partial [Sarracenia purpurea var. burkii]
FRERTSSTSDRRHLTEPPGLQPEWNSRSGVTGEEPRTPGPELSEAGRIALSPL